MQKHYKLTIGLLVCILGVGLEGTQPPAPDTKAAVAALRGAAVTTTVQPPTLLELSRSQACQAPDDRIAEVRRMAIRRAIATFEGAEGLPGGTNPLPDVTATARQAAERIGVGSVVPGGVELESAQYRTGYPVIDALLKEGEALPVVIMPPAVIKAEFQVHPKKFIDCNTVAKLHFHKWEIGQYARGAGFPFETLFKCIGTTPLRFALVWGTNDKSYYEQAHIDSFVPWKVYKGTIMPFMSLFTELNQNALKNACLDEYLCLFRSCGWSCFLLINKEGSVNTDCLYQFFSIPGGKSVLLEMPGVTVIDTGIEDLPDRSRRFKALGNGVVRPGEYDTNYYDTLNRSYWYSEGSPDGGVI